MKKLIRLFVKDWHSKEGLNSGVMFLWWLSALFIGYGLGNPDFYYLVFIGGVIYFSGLYYFLFRIWIKTN